MAFSRARKEAGEDESKRGEQKGKEEGFREGEERRGVGEGGKGS